MVSWWNILKAMPVEGWPVNYDGSVRVLPFFDTQKAEQIKQVINSEPIFHKTDNISSRDAILQSELKVADPDSAIRGANKNPIGVYTQKNSINGGYSAPTFAILNWKQKPHIVGSANKYVIITESIPPSDLLTPKYYNKQDADDESSRLYFENEGWFRTRRDLGITEARYLENLEDSGFFQSDFTQWPFWDFSEFVKGIQEDSTQFWAWSFLPELIRLERIAGYYPQQWKPSKLAGLLADLGKG